ncbi:MAG: Uma2 family endonuclease [Vulcanimicrobiaceae bacterium]
MRLAPDLGIPEVKPAIEMLRGRRVQKMSPQTRHSILQMRMAVILDAWAPGRGTVGTEWRFYLLPPNERPSSLVPDVAFVASERLPREAGPAREKPAFAPDIAVEILSPDDRDSDVAEKTALYLANGGSLVVIVDPATERIVCHECDRSATFERGEVAHSTRFEDLHLDVAAVFDSASP